MRTNNEDKLLIIATSNRPESLDEAARRRFVRRLYVPLPNCKSRNDFINKIKKDENKQDF